jgi:hypothetical protein
MNDPREVKLPRWAQEELARARQEATDAKERLATYEATLSKTSVWHGNYVDPPIYLPEHTQVHWQMREGSKTFDTITVHRDDHHGLLLHGSTSIRLLPGASNSIYVDLVD